jgi:hypothetical protein
MENVIFFFLNFFGDTYCQWNSHKKKKEKKKKKRENRNKNVLTAETMAEFSKHFWSNITANV